MEHRVNTVITVKKIHCRHYLNVPHIMINTERWGGKVMYFKVLYNTSQIPCYHRTKMNYCATESILLLTSAVFHLLVEAVDPVLISSATNFLPHTAMQQHTLSAF